MLNALAFGALACPAFAGVEGGIMWGCVPGVVALRARPRANILNRLRGSQLAAREEGRVPCSPYLNQSGLLPAATVSFTPSLPTGRRARANHSGGSGK